MEFLELTVSVGTQEEGETQRMEIVVTLCDSQLRVQWDFGKV